MDKTANDEMSSFRLKNGFRLPENKDVCQSLEITFENAMPSWDT